MFTYLTQGGPVMIPIVITSIAAGALVMIEWSRIREASRNPKKEIAQIESCVKEWNWTEALKLCEHSDHSFVKPWREGFSLLTGGKSDLQDIQEAVSLEGDKMISELESALKPLGALITILPMLGFLGTILGLLVSFHNWEQMGAHVSISSLAGGIYQAMITTAAGLIVAIPYQFFYHYAVARVQKIALEFSRETTNLFRRVKETLLEETSTPGREEPALHPTP